jgi:hypothetical protein
MRGGVTGSERLVRRTKSVALRTRRRADCRAAPPTDPILASAPEP